MCSQYCLYLLSKYVIYAYQLFINHHVGGGDINMYLISKLNILCNLRFNSTPVTTTSIYVDIIASWMIYYLQAEVLKHI